MARYTDTICLVLVMLDFFCVLKGFHETLAIYILYALGWVQLVNLSAEAVLFIVDRVDN